MRALPGLLFGTLLALGLAEAGLRAAPPTPRVQVVQLDGPDTPGEVRVVDGAPLWPSRADAARHHLACLDAPPDEERWLVLGSSILAANGLRPHEAFSTVAEARLRAEGADVCVVNVAEGAYTFQNQVAAASELLTRLRPRRVFLELWSNSPFDWRVEGARAWRFQQLAVGPDGFPNPLGLPLVWNRRAFAASRLYELVALALAAPATNDAAWAALAPRVAALAAEVRAQGGELVLVLAPGLGRPFDATLAERAARPSRSESAEYGRLVDWARGAGVEVVDLAALLRSSAVEDVALDTCCHFNAEGHRRLGEAFAAWHLDQVHDAQAMRAP